MNVEPRAYAGLAYLRRATALLTACRRADPLGGMWDAADLQWWWREDDFDVPERQLFFEGGGGAPRALLLLSPRYRTFDYELMAGEEDTGLGRQVLSTGLAWLDAQPVAPAARPRFFVRDSHERLRQLAEARGYRPTRDALVQTFLELPAACGSAPAPDGYRVRPIRPSDVVHGHQPVLATPHPGIERLAQASLYDKRHHLVVADARDRAVAECIYWIDRAAGTALLEPVATHPAYRRRGLARAMLAQALQAMARQGATVAKVSHATANVAAAALYRSLGFRPCFERVLYA